MTSGHSENALEGHSGKGLHTGGPTSGHQGPQPAQDAL